MLTLLCSLTLGPENFSVQVALAVDVALIILVSIIIDASINDGADDSGQVDRLAMDWHVMRVHELKNELKIAGWWGVHRQIWRDIKW